MARETLAPSADTSSALVDGAAAPAATPIGPGGRLYLVDGSGYIFRAYHALPPLTRKSDGAPVGAVSGFCNMLFKLLRDVEGDAAPTHLAVVFDHSGRSFRNDLYTAYKANRPPPPEDLVPQFPLVREATRAFGCPAVEMAGYEADDLIATYARQAEEAGAEVVIISSDKDLMQLVTDRVTLWDTMKDVRYDRDGVIGKWGVPPEQMIALQALTGDSVDNVPGVPGVGPKTAVQLLEEFGDLEGVLAGAEGMKKSKRRENLIAHAEDARLSKVLVTLKADVTVDEPLDSFAVAPPDGETLLDFLKSMEFRTLTRRVEESLTGKPAAASAAPAADQSVDRSQYACVQSLDVLQNWIARATAEGVVAVDCETNALDSAAADLVGVSLALGPNDACYIPLGHVAPVDPNAPPAAKAEQGDLMAADLAEETPPAPEQIPLEDAIAALRPLFEDPSVLKIGQNFKYDLAVFHRYGLNVAPYDDTMLISYVQAAGLRGHGMDELSERLLDHRCISFKEVAGTGKKQISFDKVALGPATEYAAEDADITLRLWRVLRPELAQAKKLTVYETLERPMPAVLARMELAGVKVDADRLAALSSRFAQRMVQYEEEAHALAGRPFNLGSPKQIGEIFFGEMGLPGGKKTKTGAWSTDAKVLDELAEQGHELPKILLKWRQVSKLKSTYADALREAINPQTGRVHTSFALAATTTGRLSSSDPNLQNIPVRTEEGREIREAFVPEEGHVLLAADYSQIELRLLAHYADIDALKNAFRDGVDIHAMTASEMFGVPVEGMDPMVRRQAKAINFGIIYGISAFGLANQLNIGRDEAGAYIKAYYEKFPGIKDYMDRMKEFCRTYGYVETIFGRRAHFPEIKAKNPAQRQFAERQAINAPLQGSAADIIRRAMIRMPNALVKADIQARMLLQVHDELVFEVPKDELEETTAVVTKTMAGACRPVLDLSVPLEVEAGVGANWAAAH